MYVLDEEKRLINGVWEGYLTHDDVNRGSIMIYTGERLSGQRLSAYSVVTEGSRTKIRVSGVSGTIYITYESASAPEQRIIQSESASPPALNEKEKADLTYVQMELKKKADKISTFTKQEVLREIRENGGNISIVDGGSFL